MRFALTLPALLAAAASAQEPFPSAPEPAAAGPSTADPAAELAFQTVETRMTVPVEVAGAGPYRFIVDTGAQRTVLSRELASELNLPRGRTVGLVAMTGRQLVDTVLVPSIKVSTLSGERIEAPALERRNMGAPGILGIDTLQGHAVAIDFDKEVMAVTPSKARPRRGPANRDEIVVQAKSLFGQLVVTNATYRGTKIRVVLDTGTPVTMGNEALRRRLLRHTKNMRDIELLSVIGGKMIAGYTQIPTVKIGSVTINNLPVAFSVSAPFKEWALEDKPALLLGMDALRLFRRVHIDFPNREVRFTLPRDFVAA